MAGPSPRAQQASGLGTALSLGALAASPFSGGASLGLGAGALGAGTLGGIVGAQDSAAQQAAQSQQGYLDQQADMNEQLSQAASRPRQEAMQLLEQYVPQMASAGALTSSLENQE